MATENNKERRNPEFPSQAEGEESVAAEDLLQVMTSPQRPSGTQPANHNGIVSRQIATLVLQRFAAQYSIP